MVHGLGEEKEATKERDGGITGCGDENTVEDFVVCKRVKRADRLRGEHEVSFHRAGSMYVRRKYRGQSCQISRERGTGCMREPRQIRWHRRPGKRQR